MGERLPLRDLGLSHLQSHVDRRAKAKGIKGKLSPATIKKELVTLRAAWNWAADMGLVVARFPVMRQVKLPKLGEKPPFQTWQEIERRIKIKAGGLSKKQVAELWDSLFLTLTEIRDLLEHVRTRGGIAWIYPMIFFAAHTGARRSELLRVEVADVDFDGSTVLIREKKRARGQRTTRRVPLTPSLATALQKWLAIHPGGRYLFCQQAKVFRSKKKRTAPTPITRDEAHDHFKRAMADSKWSVTRGWHVLRHSFASNCAASGVDQRLLDAWLGHTTEIRRRYLHLIPANEHLAIQSVFGA